jgi:hypothetical protein
MQRATLILFALALLFMSAGVALDANVAQYGAFNTRVGGENQTTETLVMWISNLTLAGVLLLILGAAMVLLHAGWRHQWGWFSILLVLVPIGLYAVLLAGFTANVAAGVVSLLVPIVYLAYSVRAWSEPHQGEQVA